MKNFFITITYILLGCASLEAEAVYGNSVVKDDVRELSHYSKLVANDTVHLYVIDQGENSIKIHAEENLLSHIHTDVNDDTLHIYLDKGIKPSKQITIYLGAKNLSEISLTGTVFFSVEAPISVDELLIRASGISQASFSNLSCKDLMVNLEGSSTVKLKGRAEKQNVQVKGASAYRALDFVTNVTIISVAGAGKAWVNATDTLELTLSGAAYLGYKGGAAVQESITGVGRLENLPEE